MDIFLPIILKLTIFYLGKISGQYQLGMIFHTMYLELSPCHSFHIIHQIYQQFTDLFAMQKIAADIYERRLRNNGTDNVQMVLGLFHLVMLYLGALGYIMAGSGISELFAVAYAPNTIKHILSGHAFSRARRAHMLAFTALGQIICDGPVQNEKKKYKEYADSIFEE